MFTLTSRRLIQRSFSTVMKNNLPNQIIPSVFSTFTSSSTSFLQISSYHTTCISLAKKEKKGKKEEETESLSPTVSLPPLSKYDTMMEGTINWFTNELAKIQSANRITADFFNNLSVETYGNIGRAGQVTLTPGGGSNSAGKLSIHLYDSEIASAVMAAIKDCGLGVNPIQDGSMITGSIPKASKETRDALIKNISKMAEKAKNDVRNHRKDCNDAIKKCKGHVSEDDSRRLTKDIDTLTDKKLDKITQLIKKKETEIQNS